MGDLKDRMMPNFSSTKARLSELNAVIGCGWGPPCFQRLQFRPEYPYSFDKTNDSAICDFADYLLTMGERCWAPNPDLFEPSPDEVTIATVERYGLPLRTVFSMRTGLMRSDPYYPPVVLENFYQKHYRGIYVPFDTPYSGASRQRILSDQINKGVHFHNVLRRERVEFDSVLDFGCGMGGMLVPFKQDGKRCVGCDLGPDYLRDGRTLGLDLILGGIKEVRAAGPFDLVIVSHVLEHMPHPKSFLMAMQEMLTEHGAILIEVPGIRSIPTWYQGDILGYLQNAHVWHFSQSTLRRLMTESGFETVYGDDVVLCIGRKSDISVISSATRNPQFDLDFLKQVESTFLSRFSLRNRLRRRLSRLHEALAW